MNLALLGIILIIIAVICYIISSKTNTKWSSIIFLIGIIINIIGLLLIYYFLFTGGESNNSAAVGQYKYYVNGVQVSSGAMASIGLLEKIVAIFMIFVLGFTLPLILATSISDRRKL